MAEVPRSSFIPKQAKTAVSSRVQKKRRFNILGFISMILLLGALVLAGGTYLYKSYAQKQLQQEKQALVDARGKFNESDIASVRELDARFRAANYLLSRHLAPSQVLNTLGLNTNQNVQFTSFAYSQLGSGDVSVTINGATDAFKAVALQALAFGKTKLLQNAVFTKLSNSAQTNVNSTSADRGQTNSNAPEISFNVTGQISPSLIAYSGLNTNGDTAVPTQAASGGNAATTTAASSTSQSSNGGSPNSN